MNPARQTTRGGRRPQVAEGQVEGRRSGWSAGRNHGGVDPGPEGPFQPVGAGAVGGDPDTDRPSEPGSAAGPAAPGGYEPWPETARPPLVVRHGLPGFGWVLGTADAAIGDPLRQPPGGG